MKGIVSTPQLRRCLWATPAAVYRCQDQKANAAVFNLIERQMQLLSVAIYHYLLTETFSVHSSSMCRPELDNSSSSARRG